MANEYNHSNNTVLMSGLIMQCLPSVGNVEYTTAPNIVGNRRTMTVMGINPLQILVQNDRSIVNRSMYIYTLSMSTHSPLLLSARRSNQ